MRQCDRSSCCRFAVFRLQQNVLRVFVVDFQYSGRSLRWDWFRSVAFRMSFPSSLCLFVWCLTFAIPNKLNNKFAANETHFTADKRESDKTHRSCLWKECFSKKCKFYTKTKTCKVYTFSKELGCSSAISKPSGVNRLLRIFLCVYANLYSYFKNSNTWIISTA